MINLSKIFIGNDHLVEQFIKNFMNHTLSNSIIFSGPKGIGKSTLTFFLITKIFDSLIINNNNNFIKLIYNNTHPNIRYINREYDNKTKKFKSKISINQIRNLENFIHQSSFDHLPKFVILDSADDLNINSANSLLKILEEPKDNTFFILIAHQISSLLPTIRSRCIKFNINLPNIDKFTKILKLQDNDFYINDIDFLFNISAGSPGLAIKISSEKNESIFNDILEILINQHPLSSNVINLSNRVSKFSNDEFKIFISLLKFILINATKFNLGFNYEKKVKLNFFKYIFKAANILNNNTLMKILEYVNENEKDLYIYNLDKKIFCLNIFTPLKINL